jgi:hypothetical protein
MDSAVDQHPKIATILLPESQQVAIANALAIVAHRN